MRPTPARLRPRATQPAPGGARATPAPTLAAPTPIPPALVTPPRPSSPRALFQLFPQLEPEHAFLPLGEFPTPVEPIDLRAIAPGAEAFAKRDDLSSPLYGGNKVRTLEALLGVARRQGNTTILATGAYGSNHSVATLLHARRAGFRAAAALFPQPLSQTARDNLRVSLTQSDAIVDLPHWSFLPYALRRHGGVAQPARAPFVMPPGGAIPRGCLGFLSAGLELCLQIDAGLLPRPDEIILGIGSTCSTAGLLVGLRLGARLGIGYGLERSARSTARREPPRLVAVRVTPWPLTSALRVLHLARRVTTALFRQTSDPLFDIPRSELARSLELDGSQLGPGYAEPTRAGLDAIAALSSQPFALDTTYSAKAAAALLARTRRGPARIRLFWCTKSSAPLPPVPQPELARAPARMLRWLSAND